MNSLIFRTAANLILLITLLFSVWVLLRGHNAPGGGFIGGLISSSGFALYLLAKGAPALRRILKFNLAYMMSFGLLLIFLSGMAAIMEKKIFLTGVWIKLSSLRLVLGSPLLFDVGVYFVVLSSTLIIMLALEEST